MARSARAARIGNLKRYRFLKAGILVLGDPIRLGCERLLSVAGASLASIGALWLGFRWTVVIGAVVYVMRAGLCG